MTTAPSQPVTAETIQMRQLRVLFEESTEARVVRAAARALVGSFGPVPFIETGDDLTRECLRVCAAAYNARFGGERSKRT